MAQDRAVLLSILLSTSPAAAQANVLPFGAADLPESHSTAIEQKPGGGGVLVADETQRSRIAGKVTAIIARVLGVEAERVDEGADLVMDLGADSLDTVEIMMTLEEEFGWR